MTFPLCRWAKRSPASTGINWRATWSAAWWFTQAPRAADGGSGGDTPLHRDRADHGRGSLAADGLECEAGNEREVRAGRSGELGRVREEGDVGWATVRVFDQICGLALRQAINNAQRSAKSFRRSIIPRSPDTRHILSSQPIYFSDTLFGSAAHPPNGLGILALFAFKCGES